MKGFFHSTEEALGETIGIELTSEGKADLAARREKEKALPKKPSGQDKIPTKPNLELRNKNNLSKVQQELVFAKTLLDFQTAMNQRATLGEISAQEEAGLSLKFLTLVNNGKNIPEGMDKARWDVLKKIASANNRGEFWEAIAAIEDTKKLTFVEKQAILWKDKNIGEGEGAGFHIDRRTALRAMEILDEIK